MLGRPLKVRLSIFVLQNLKFTSMVDYLLYAFHIFSGDTKYLEGLIDPDVIFAIASNGTLYQWGENLQNPLKYILTPNKYKFGKWSQIYSGLGFACGLPFGSGKPQCWSFDKSANAPNVVKALKYVSGDIIQLSVGYYHACGITRNGSLQCWGDGDTAALGNGSTNQKINFAIVQDSHWEYVSAGSYHTCAIKKEASLWCWGSNDRNQASPEKSPIVKRMHRVPGKWKSVSAGHQYTVAINTEGKAYGWGVSEDIADEYATGGNLGTGKPMCYNPQKEDFCAEAGLIDGYVAVEKNPIAVAGNIRWASIHAGDGISCGIEEGFPAKGYCFGYTWGEEYALGSPQTNNPLLVDNTSSWAVLKAGYGRVRCGIKIDGSLWCWGRTGFDCDDDCVLGDGTRKNSGKPVKVIGVDNWLP